MSQNKKLKYITKSQEAHFVENISSDKKHKLIILLMLDGGLRVGEAVRVKVGDFNFRDKILTVESEKKRKDAKDKFRDIPINTRLFEAVADYWEILKDKKVDSYLFKSKTSGSGHITRQSVDKQIRKIDKRLSAHKFRHTFTTKIVNEGNDFAALQNAQKLLGHKSIKTTEAYTHVSRDRLIDAVNSLDVQKTWLQRLFTSKKKIQIFDVDKGSNKFIIGRDNEIREIHSLTLKKVNTLILGGQGIGKKHLLENLNIEKCLRIHELSSVKKILGGMLLELLKGDKEAVADLLFKDDTERDKIITKDSVFNLTKLLIEITEKDEYTIIVYDIEKITPSAVKALERLNQHFHLICAARKITISKATFLTNFDKIKLQGLKRHESLRLVDMLSVDFANRIEDYEAYRNKIVSETDGNPKFISEMVERFGRESFVTVEMVADKRHNAASKEIDMTIYVVVGISSLMLLRYFGRETGETSFTFIGGIFMMFALFARSLMRAGSRKYL